MQCLAEREGKTWIDWLVTHWEMNLFFLFFLRSKIDALVREPTLLPPIWPGFESCGWSFSLPLLHPERFFCGSSAFPPLPRNKLLPLLIFFSLSYLIRATLHYLNNLCTDPPPLRKNRPFSDFSWGEWRGGEWRGGERGGVSKEATIWSPGKGYLKKDDLFKFQIDQEWQRTNNQLCGCATSRYLFIYSFIVIYFENQRNYLEVHISCVAFTKTWDSSRFLRN